ncbi:MAG: glycosyltransferase [SAR324 cluster bacterium]|nr:glycosyltransferase [SAR324 cluster bacterium]
MHKATLETVYDKNIRIVAWGTYDLSKPRTRILLRAIREAGVDIVECHQDVWGGVEDKSRISGLVAVIRVFGRWLSSYPKLIWRYLRISRHDIVIVPYMGHLDILVIWPFARLRRVPIVWDAFLSLYNTVVEDRELVHSRHPLALLLYIWEWLACHAADLVLVDTKAHAQYFVETFQICAERIGSVFVGAEPEIFPATGNIEKDIINSESTTTILFYGQFIPLHGILTIIEAARLAKDLPIRWIIVGRGQEAASVQRLLNSDPIPSLTWVPWVPYDQLVEIICNADICLGIFGTSRKAGMVIPNKVFQILSTGAPLITRDSPAIRELLDPNMPGVFLIPPGDPKCLVGAINEFRLRKTYLLTRPLHEAVRQTIHPGSIGRNLMSHLSRIHVGV